MLEERRILITGGAGFIGSHLAEALVEHNNIVKIYDNFNPFYFNKEANIKRLKEAKNCTLIKGDILDLNSLKQAIGNDTELIFHIAAQPGVRFSVETPFKTNEINVTGTLNMLVAVQNSNVEKLINASSSSVYGTPQYLPIDEKHPTNPVSPYGASKLAAEKYCKAFYRIYGINVCSLRFFTVYGPRQRPDMAIHIFTQQILKNESPTIFGDGNQTRDFTFVDDTVSGIIASAEAKDTAGEDFNLGKGERCSVNNLISLLIKITGNAVEPNWTKIMKGDVSHTWADITKAKKMLGYDPQTSIETGLEEFVEWYKSTPYDQIPKASP
ncbi:GDP-mannose 4,6-dehydratase [Candidatus Borrarchaeum sp.]|uniref:GDP-mannose 4,6-dehydratase n=1 Tax=Candidatus Borrarchaeum sp. TaxID=2846742 RepID=UPI00257E7A1B|nr:GDP-mannose 4,6-dehydratase [Candidatus Borrarchaeum sp.]